MATTPDRSTPVPYVPAAPGGVGELARATWDEFYRISRALFEVDRPASIQGSSAESVTVSAATVWDRLFDEADAVQWENPEAQLNRATGVWTCPSEGLYLMLPVVEVPAFATPASKLYTASLRTTIAHVGGGTEVIVSTAGGDDRVPLRVQPVIMRPFNRNDTVYFDLDLTHETKTGSVSVMSVLNVVRQSGVK